MRILVLNYEFPPVGGGASAASFFGSRELVRRGHDVDVLTCRSTGQADFERIDGVCVYRVVSLRKGIHDAGIIGALTFVWFARRRLRKLLEENDYDIAHIYFAVPTGLLSFAWRKSTSAPYIVSLRGSDVPGYDEQATMINLLHRLLKPITRRILKNAGAIVANSSNLQALALKSFPEQQIMSITNGVCAARYSPDSVPRHTANITAVCVARCVQRKGIDVLLNALTQLQIENLRVSVIGSGPLQDELQDRARRLQLSGRVDFLGEVEGQALVEKYRQADFLIHPTRTESFSMTLLEGMSCGLPVIASNVGGVPELVTHDVNGFLVKPGDAGDLARAIKRMVGSAEDRNRFSRENRVKIEREYTWAEIVRQYEAKCFLPLTGNRSKQGIS